MRLILEVVGDRTSECGRSKVDGHVQNSGPTITNRKISQTGSTWSCDQSCRVVPSITLDRGLTSRATGRAICGINSRLVVRYITICHDWLHDLILVVQPVICWWFHIKGLGFKITLDIFIIQECLKSLLETTASCQVLRPMSCNFLIILERRVLGFMLLILEFAMILHWIILLSLILFLFHFTC